MPVTIHLTRTLAKRSTISVAEELLKKAVQNSLKSVRYLSLKKLSVYATGEGHKAQLDFSGNISPEYVQRFIVHLNGVLTQRFNPPWVIIGENPGEVSASDGGTVKIAERPVGNVNLNIPPETFSRIYGREAQIRRVIDALSIGKDTNWNKRKHTLLSGPPGSGKTELCLALARALGQEGESWLWFDATSTTKAGALEQLMKAPSLPPVLFVEEIEKVQENALRWLLSIMDERGEIRRTNYRVGNQVRSVRLTVVATANNVNLLRSMDAGAIYSRFGNRIYCPPPSRDVLYKILEREVSEIGGDLLWVDAAIKFGHDQLHIEDCREIMNILLCGRDRLLNGEYQRDFLDTLPLDEQKTENVYQVKKLWEQNC